MRPYLPADSASCQTRVGSAWHCGPLIRCESSREAPRSHPNRQPYAPESDEPKQRSYRRPGGSDRGRVRQTAGVTGLPRAYETLGYDSTNRFFRRAGGLNTDVVAIPRGFAPPRLRSTTGWQPCSCLRGVATRPRDGHGPDGRYNARGYTPSVVNGSALLTWGCVIRSHARVAVS